ncbi:MAG: carbohydrate ABC transporter permease, partial [Clostridiales bacterium]|nr:carbohydrate ABC transporter permease [Clostridiales bacterium]
MKTKVKTKVKTKKKKSVYSILLNLFFVALSIIMLYPFYYVVIMSFANATATAKHVPYLLPYVIDLTGYKTIFNDASFFRSFGISVFVTVVGVCLNMFLSVTGAYVLSKKKLIGRNFFLTLILFTMLFSGGLVPSYLNIKNLGLINTVWSMILPTGISTYYMIIMKNYFTSLPESLEEAAKLDGANSFVILTKIIIPISMPFMATFALFYAVERWNEWYNAMLYINVKAYQP